MSKAQSAAESTVPAVSFGEECHPGLKREDNQDSVVHVTTPHGELFVIADGVGGYYGGAEASRIVTSGFPRHLAVLPTSMTAEAVLIEAARRVNAEVFAAGQSGDVSRRRMSSTVVLALLVQQGGQTEAVIGNVGDSRAYLVRGGQMMQLSADHTAAQGMLDAGVLTPLQAKDHPHASVLTRTMGQAPEVVLDLKRLRLQAEDQILLCSDGLHAYAKTGEILTVLTSSQLSAAATAKALLDLALAAGGPDNISVQVVRLPGSAGPGAAMIPSVQKRSRTIPLALGGAAAVLLASLAGVKYYESWQAKPVLSGPVKGQQQGTVTVPPRPEENAGTNAEPKAGTANPARQTARPPRVAGLMPAVDPERSQYIAYKNQKKFINDVDAAHQASCERITGDKPIAYHRGDAVLKEVPATDPELKSYFTFKPYTLEVETACGKYDLLLLPTRSATHAQPIKDALKNGRIQARKSGHEIKEKGEALGKKIEDAKQNQ